MIRVIFDQQQGADGLIFDIQFEPQSVAIKFPLLGLLRAFPIKTVQVFPLAGKRRTYP